MAVPEANPTKENGRERKPLQKKTEDADTAKKEPAPGASVSFMQLFRY
jgi:hypothetical protein